ncbi:MAG: hypothetical protein HRU38_02015 [Saccharospirillaceae bacterium]|nr:hypothetical protein [Pseudomonadales bacterium]NRB77435.1 hypothetical protein [Saccharospirillaceae bacterium]
MLLYEVPNIIKIFYEKENELFIHEWLEYNPEDQDNKILNILQYIYESLLIYPVAKIIVKSDKTKGIFSLEVQKYIKNIQFPRLMADTKLRYVATIKSEDVIKKIGVKIWQLQFKKDDDIILQNVNNEIEAREWLKSINQA